MIALPLVLAFALGVWLSPRARLLPHRVTLALLGPECWWCERRVGRGGRLTEVWAEGFDLICDDCLEKAKREAAA